MKKLAGLSRGTQLFIVMTILYGLFAFILPASPVTKATYQINDEAYHALLFVVRLPIILTWCVAYFGFSRLTAYARQIKDTPEGKGFLSIARGMGWVAWGMIMPAFISSLLNAVANVHHGFLSTALIITNYLYVFASVVAFSYIAIGTHTLVHQSKVKIGIKHIQILVAILVAMGVLFGALISARLHGHSMGDSFNAFYLPNWLVWTTIVAPYLYAWFMGTFAALELVLIARRTSGIIYKQALQLLAIGLILIIWAFCSLQYFRSIVPRTGHLTIGSSLITVYIIYGVSIAGTIALVSGVQRLKRIEDI
jgi:hypothetical protein